MSSTDCKNSVLFVSVPDLIEASITHWPFKQQSKPCAKHSDEPLQLTAPGSTVDEFCNLRVRYEISMPEIETPPGVLSNEASELKLELTQLGQTSENE